MSKGISKKHVDDAKPVHGVGYLHFMRRIEQETHDKPRIGESTAIAEEPVKIGQDPFMGFPAHDFARLDDTPQQPKHPPLSVSEPRRSGRP